MNGTRCWPSLAKSCAFVHLLLVAIDLTVWENIIKEYKMSPRGFRRPWAKPPNCGRRCQRWYVARHCTLSHFNSLVGRGLVGWNLDWGGRWRHRTGTGRTGLFHRSSTFALRRRLSSGCCRSSDRVANIGRSLGFANVARSVPKLLR